MPKICFYLLKTEENNDCEHSLLLRFLNTLKTYQEITPEEFDKIFHAKNLEEKGEKHYKHIRIEDSIKNNNNIVLNNSFDEKNLSLSYYSGNLFSLSDEKKNISFFDSGRSIGEDLWMESIHS